MTLKAKHTWFTLKVKDASSKQSEIFTAIAISFHLPSEHYLDGKQMDLVLKNRFYIFPQEMEILMKTDQNKYGKLSILAMEKSNYRNALIEPFAFVQFNLILKNLIIKKAAVNLKANGMSNLLEIDFGQSLMTELQKIQAPLGYFSYQGSLTTPPCLDIINWVILDKPLGISSETLNMFREMSSHKNNRVLQKRQQIKTIIKGQVKVISKRALEISEELLHPPIKKIEPKPINSQIKKIKPEGKTIDQKTQAQIIKEVVESIDQAGDSVIKAADSLQNFNSAKKGF